jgi:hypothetical protein
MTSVLGCSWGSHPLLICVLEEYATPLAKTGAMDTNMQTSWLAFHWTTLSTTGERRETLRLSALAR